MFCGKCGTAIPEGALFCPDCGTPVAVETEQQMSAQETAQETVTHETETQEAATQETAAQETATATAVAEPCVRPADPQPETPVVKKRKKWWIGVLIALGVVIAAAAAAWFIFPRDVQHLLFGDQKYASRLAEQSAEKLADGTVDALVGSSGTKEEALSGKFVLEMDDALRTALKKETGMTDDDFAMLDALVTYLNSVSLRMEGKADGDTTQAVYQIIDTDGTLATAQMSVKGQQFAVRVPELSDRYFALTLEEDYANLFKAPQVDRDKLQKSLDALVDTYVKSLDRAAYSYEKAQTLTAHGVSVTEDCTVVKLSGNDMTDMLIAMLETMRDDAYLKSLAENRLSALLAVSAAEGETSGKATGYETLLNELIDGLKSAKNEMADASLTIRTYLDRRNHCVGKQYTLLVDGEKMTLAVVLGEENAVSFTMADAEYVYATWKQDDTSASGTIAARVDTLPPHSSFDHGYIGLSFTATDLKEETYNGATVQTGSFTFALLDPQHALAGMVGNEVAEYLTNARLTYTTKVNGDAFDVALRLKVPELGTLGLDMQLTAKATLPGEMPAQTADNTYTFTLEQLESGKLDAAIAEEWQTGLQAWGEKLQNRKSFEPLLPLAELIGPSQGDASAADALPGEWVMSMALHEYLGTDYADSALSVDIHMTLTADGKLQMGADLDKLERDLKQGLRDYPEDIAVFGEGSLEDMQQAATDEGYTDYAEFVEELCDAYLDLLEEVAVTDSVYTCDGSTITIDGEPLSYTLMGDTLNIDGLVFYRVS